MTNKRIHQIAKEYNISSEALIKILRDLKFKPKSHMSVATEDMISAVSRKFDIEKENAKKDIRHKQAMATKRNQQSATAKTATSDGAGSVGKPPAGQPLSTEKILSKMQTTMQRRSGGPQRSGPRRPGDHRRDRKKRTRHVDTSAVSRAFKSTMASMATTKKKKYRRRGAKDGEEIEVGNILQVTEFMSLSELSKLLEEKPATLIKKLFEMGQMATINQRLDIDTIEMICLEFDFGIEQVAEIGDLAREEEREVDLVKRPPVVTVMGHVDHGKTSLLDYIRKTDVVSGESGAITQHIGAYHVTTSQDEEVTFLDTPGHEAFTAMRARGAQVTDIVVIVVAADDGVRPQTVEAIDHAKAANAPIVVAINKIDKPEADLDKVKNELSKHGLVAEEWGGDTVMTPISAKTGEGVDKLLEMITITSELKELKADPSIRGAGAVIEAKLEKGRGPVATVLVQKGVAKVGDSIVAGACHGRVRSIMDDHGRKIDKISPGLPGQITGLDGVPSAGDSFLVTKDDSEAREIAAKRLQIRREYQFRRPKAQLTLESVFSQIQDRQIKDLNVLIKGDVDGSVEALSEIFTRIEHDEVRVNIIHQAVGAISESDVLLAAASNGIIIGFHIGPTPRAREVASREKVDIRTYEVVYEAEKDIRASLEGLLTPEITERHTGIAEVRDLFKAPKIGVIAGCHVTEGTIKRSDRVNLMREGKKIYTGDIGSLRRFKDDVREVQSGYDCGINIENFNDIKIGDTIEGFVQIEVARKLQTN